MPENAGVIVRTAAEGAAEEELSRDVARLAAQWEAIEKKSKTASAPAMLYGEPDLTIRVIRDVFNEDFGKLVVSGDEAWDVVDEYVRYVAPHLAERVTRWQGDRDAFAEYRIDEQLAKALERKVWLPSGGSLVIDKTEAMTVVDVNTGKFTGQGGNLEETVTRNNLEAAEEIVRQLRLRDVGGIVVIDFIDMVLESNRELVLRRLLECLSRDRTKHQVAEVTSLGLVQMTRKRVGAGLLEAFSTPCECCNGRGVILTFDPDSDGHATPSTRTPAATAATAVTATAVMATAVTATAAADPARPRSPPAPAPPSPPPAPPRPTPPRPAAPADTAPLADAAGRRRAASDARRSASAARLPASADSARAGRRPAGQRPGPGRRARARALQRPPPPAQARRRYGPGHPSRSPGQHPAASEALTAPDSPGCPSRSGQPGCSGRLGILSGPGDLGCTGATEARTIRRRCPQPRTVLRLASAPPSSRVTQRCLRRESPENNVVERGFVVDRVHSGPPDQPHSPDPPR